MPSESALAKAAKWTITSEEIVEGLNELIGLTEHGVARITIFMHGGASVAIGDDHSRSQFMGKTAEEALVKARDTILKARESHG